MDYSNTLKRHSKLFGVVLLAILISSCSDFLNESPQSNFGTSDFYKTKDDFAQAVNAIYTNQQSLYTGNQFYLLGDLRSDNIVGDLVTEGNGNDQLNPIDQFGMTSANGTLEPLWGTSYNGISRANRVITYIEGADISGKETIKGQAQALRALFYFNLVRHFGKVQLVTKPEIDINTEFVSTDSVYNQIITDLQNAVSNLPLSYSDGTEGRITKGAAQSLLGTVYLTRGNFADAETAFEKVVNPSSEDPSYNYSLRGNYMDLWTTAEQGSGKESIWRVIYRADKKGNGSRYANWFAPDAANADISLLGKGNGNAFGFFIPTYDLINAYESGDVRKGCIGESYTDTQAEPDSTVRARYVKCYTQQDLAEGGGKASAADFYIIRYADVLLRYAEALNENGKTGLAITQVNKVRNRAGIGSTTASGQADVREEIYKQQRLESPFEGHRWNDLVRTDRYVDVMNSKLSSDSTAVGPETPIQSSSKLVPIPQRVITTSGATQNPGY